MAKEKKQENGPQESSYGEIEKAIPGAGQAPVQSELGRGTTVAVEIPLVSHEKKSSARG